MHFFDDKLWHLQSAPESRWWIGKTGESLQTIATNRIEKHFCKWQEYLDVKNNKNFKNITQTSKHVVHEQNVNGMYRDFKNMSMKWLHEFINKVPKWPCKKQESETKLVGKHSLELMKIT